MFFLIPKLVEGGLFQIHFAFCLIVVMNKEIGKLINWLVFLRLLLQVF